MRPTPITGHRRTAGIVSGTVSSLLAAAVAVSFPGAAHAQQDTQPVPAPVVRVQRHPPAQTDAGNAPKSAPSNALRSVTNSAPKSAPSSALKSTPSTAGQNSPAAPAVHRPRPVPSLLPDGTPATVASPHRPAAVTPQGAAAPSGHTAPAIQSAAPKSAVPTTTATTTAATPATTPAKSAKPAPEHPSNTIRGLNRNVIVLDPGHGGPDTGARIGDNTLEKNVTLALAFRLRSLLLARGFTVVLTRDSDAATLQTTSSSTPTPLTLDDRAGIANHAHAAACLLLHATGRGTGLHVYNSEITPVPAEPYLVPWLTGQSAWVPASRALEGQVSAALGRSGITLLASTASVRPVDSLTCPALVLELAPENGTPASINGAAYQERVAAALAGALVVWENAVQPPPRLPAPVHVTHHTAPADTTASAARNPATPEAQR